jgi:hyperosmotically inducible periplasmic protein
MNMKSASCLIAAAALVGSFAGCATESNNSSARNASITEKVEDSWITTKVKSEFAVDKTVSATNIHVDTNNGVVRLSGVAKSTEEANKAVSIAKGVKGVTSVRNDMQIQGVGATR